MYDVAIIGTGPAGLSAALNLKLHNKSFVWFGSKALSDKVQKSEKIANYPGLEMISGNDLNKHFMAQIKSMGIEISEKMVTNIASTRKGFMVLADNDIYDAKAVILAVGAVTAKGLEGEERLLGHGVSYCATCDGFLYPEKTLAIFCGSERFEHEVEYLANIASKVYLYTTYESKLDLPNVEILQKPIKEICGDKKVEAIKLTDKSEIKVDGAFFLRNAVKPATLVNGLEMDGVHIKVDRACKTNKAGVFACGDCTGRPYQLTKAVGEGNIAAHSVLEYLSEEKQ